MLFLPLTLVLVLLLGFLLVALFVLVELRVLAYAYRKIGVRPRYIFGLLLLTLLGSQIKVPLYSVRVERVVAPQAVWMFGRPYEVPESRQPGATVVAVNVGGALIPTLLSLYLLVRARMVWQMLLGTAVVGVIMNQLAQVIPGVGIVVPMLVPPLVAATIALLLAIRRAPPVAYVSGSMGTLIGADLVNLGRVAEMGAPIVSIGGAGTFDGVFLTGIIAGLLA